MTKLHAKTDSISLNIESELEICRARYIDSHPESNAAFENSRQYMPGGNTRTVLFHSPFPLRISHATGNLLFDVDGCQYINFLGEYTAGLFGHNNTIIREAIDKALDRGVSLSAHNEDEIRLAELVCNRFPSMDKVRFTNSGTEANLLAISSARHFTSKKKVMVFEGGYHGGLLYFGGGGIPINAPFDYVVAPYNNVEATVALIKQHADQLACIVVEPMQGASGCIPGSNEFLQMLRDQSLASESILIFDEVMTSRLSESGFQGKSGIIPDMTTLGKYVGGGMSFGAFGGRDDIMKMYDPTTKGFIPHAGTFNNNSITMAAGVAAMRDVITQENLRFTNGLGDQLRGDLNDLFRSKNLRLQATGSGSLIGLHTTDCEIRSTQDLVLEDDRLMELLFLNLLEQGCYVARRGFIALMLTISNKEKQELLLKIDGIVSRHHHFFQKIK